jgi:prepilin-type N-terminal cleavage/methylation domain-containing protein
VKIFGEIRRQKNEGFTVVEVIVASVIFALTAAGIFATVSALNQPATESSEEVTAVFLGKRILEDLRKDVDATTWTGGPLDPANSPYTMNAVVVDGVTYTPVYSVMNDPNGTSARKVTLNILW